jgi:quinol monooxygenase YgiN
MTPHAVFITHRTKAGQRSDAEAVWRRIMQPAIEANPNHITYVYTLPADEPDVIRAFQLYRTAEDAASFLRTPDYLEYSEAVEAYLDGPPQVASAPAAWVKASGGA